MQSDPTMFLAPSNVDRYGGECEIVANNGSGAAPRPQRKFGGSGRGNIQCAAHNSGLEWHRGGNASSVADYANHGRQTIATTQMICKIKDSKIY
jgi:hypothetical protein